MSATMTQPGSGRLLGQKIMSRYFALSLMEKSGEITELRRDVKYEVIPPTLMFPGEYFTADFVYVDAKGREVVEFVRSSYDTPTRELYYPVHRRLMYFRFAILVLEV